jgi:hypothetical protein
VSVPATDSPPSRPAGPRPQPGLLRTIGVLDILFGAVFLLGGLAGLKVTAPVVIHGMPLEIDPPVAQAFFDEIRQQRLNDLHARQREAATEAERDRVRREAATLEAMHPRVADEVDLPRVNANLAWLVRYLKIDLLTGPPLNLLMVIAGIGLMWRRNWARRLGAGTAALKIVRLIALAVFLLGFALPRLSTSLDALLDSQMGRQLITHAITQQRAQLGNVAAGGGPPPSPKEVVRMFRDSGMVSAIVFVCVASIYPAIALILLCLPGARAACAGGEAATEAIPQA